MAGHRPRTLNIENVLISFESLALGGIEVKELGMATLFDLEEMGTSTSDEGMKSG